MSDFKAKCTKNRFRQPQTPLGELIARDLIYIPRPLAGIKGTYFYEKGRVREVGKEERKRWQG